MPHHASNRTGPEGTSKAPRAESQRRAFAPQLSEYIRLVTENKVAEVNSHGPSSRKDTGASIREVCDERGLTIVLDASSQRAPVGIVQFHGFTPVDHIEDLMVQREEPGRIEYLPGYYPGANFESCEKRLREYLACTGFAVRRLPLFDYYERTGVPFVAIGIRELLLGATPVESPSELTSFHFMRSENEAIRCRDLDGRVVVVINRYEDGRHFAKQSFDIFRTKSPRDGIDPCIPGQKEVAYLGGGLSLGTKFTRKILDSDLLGVMDKVQDMREAPAPDVASNRGKEPNVHG